MALANPAENNASSLTSPSFYRVKKQLKIDLCWVAKKKPPASGSTGAGGLNLGGPVWTAGVFYQIR